MKNKPLVFDALMQCEPRHHTVTRSELEAQLEKVAKNLGEGFTTSGDRINPTILEALSVAFWDQSEVGAFGSTLITTPEFQTISEIGRRVRERIESCVALSPECGKLVAIINSAENVTNEEVAF